MHKIVIAVTGASGSIFAKIMLEKLLPMTSQLEKIGLVMSDNAKEVWKHELGNSSFESFGVEGEDLVELDTYSKNDFFAPFASGSGQYDTMIIIPCSMGMMGRIADGISDDLVTRAADVTLKERRKLILVIREAPYNLIHIKNMESITLAGGIICPATPSFLQPSKNH